MAVHVALPSDDPGEINRLDVLGKRYQRGLYGALDRHSSRNHVEAPALLLTSRQALTPTFIGLTGLPG